MCNYPVLILNSLLTESYRKDLKYKKKGTISIHKVQIYIC